MHADPVHLGREESDVIRVAAVFHLDYFSAEFGHILGSQRARQQFGKIENADASVTSEVDLVNAVANAWEPLNYDFTGAPGFDPSVEYVRAVIFFDFGNAGDGSTYYWDDLQFGVAP